MQRRALLCMAVPAAAAALARPALAWREQAADAAVVQAWADRCAGMAPGAGAVTLCPFCGCPVSGAADHGEGRAAAAP